MTLRTCCLRGEINVPSLFYRIDHTGPLYAVCTALQSVFTLSVSQVDQSSLQVLLARQVGFRAIHGI